MNRRSKNRAGRNASSAITPPDRTHAPKKTRQERIAEYSLAALAALLVSIVLIPSELAALAQGSLVVPVTLLLALAVVWTGLAVSGGKLKLRVNWGDGLALLFFGWLAVSSIVMLPHGDQRQMLNSLWPWLGMAAAFFLCRQLIRTPAQQRAVVVLMLALCSLLAALGAYQYFFSLPAQRAAFAADPENTMRMAGFDPTDANMREMFRSRVQSSEPFATFSLTNSLAGVLAPWGILALGLLLWGRNTAGKKRLLAAGGLSLLLIGICLLLTKSRTAYLAASLGIVLLAAGSFLRGAERLLQARIVLPVLIFFALLLAAGVFAIGTLDTELFSGAPKSLLFRFHYWQASGQLIGDYPWFGCGAGSFQDYYTAYKLPQATETVADPHNLFVEIAATAGLPALVFFVVMLGAYLLFSLQNSRRTPSATNDKSEKSLFIGGLFGLLLAFPAGLAVGFLPDISVLLIGLPAAAAVAWLWWNWLDKGTLPRLLPLVALSVLLINLLAAGGISFPGVALSLWLLVALALADENGAGYSLPSWGALLLLVFLVAASLACLLTYSRPVLTAQVNLQAAQTFQQQGDLTQAIELLEQAANNDPWSAEPPRLLAALRFQVWQRNSTDEDWTAFEIAAATAVRLAPRSYRTSRQVGDWYLAAYRQTRKQKALESAVDYYLRTVELYPNSNIQRAQYAWSLSLWGKKAAAAKQAQKALALDAANPDAHQKLVNYKVFDPSSKARNAAEAVAEVARLWPR